MALPGFDSQTATISQGKSPKAEVTEPLTGIFFKNMKRSKLQKN
jgi:hypothetical protein